MSSHKLDPGYELQGLRNGTAASHCKPKPQLNSASKATARKPRFVNKPSLSMSDYKKFKFISNIKNIYKFSDFLGSGAFGQVRKCVHIDTGSEFAIKIMRKEMVKKRKIYV